MSWVKSLPAPGCEEDVFDENASEMAVQEREWLINMKRRLRDGYVDGADFGEDGALEIGFNLGLKEGAALTTGIGRLKGIVSAIWCWYQLQHPQEPLPTCVADLLSSIMQHEDAIVEGMRRNYEERHASVSDVSETIADMEVCEGEQRHCEAGCGETDCCKRQQKEGDVPKQRQELSFSSAENLDQLVQRCLDLVVELGLPQELISHIQDAKTAS